MNITRGPSILSDADPERVHFDTAAAPGTDAEGSRSDHHHQLNDPTVPTTQAFGDAAATGSEVEAAREDHLHGMPANPPGEFFVLAARHSADTAPYTADVGLYRVSVLSSSEQVGFNFKVPDDFAALTECVVLIIPDVSETVQWDVTVGIAAVGEAFNNDEGSTLNSTLAVTLSELTELDVSGPLGSIAAGDYVGMSFASDTTSLRVVGLLFRYTK